MSKRRRALDSDESEEEFEAPTSPLGIRTRSGRKTIGSDNEDDDQIVKEEANDATEDASNGATDNDEADDDVKTFPVKLQIGKKRPGNEEDEEYNDEEVESAEQSSSADDYSELSDDGFIVDSDDNVIRQRRGRKRTRSRKPAYRPKRRSERLRNRPRSPSPSEGELSAREELRELRSPSPRRVERELRARTKPINYMIRPPPTLEEIDRMRQAGPSKSSAGTNRSNNPLRSLYPVNGPFGGNDVVSIFNPKKEEIAQVLAETSVPLPNAAGAELNVIGASSVADTDPLGIETNIDFKAVGGLEDYIDRLKEMVSLPLLYPDVYKRFGITPPRGVLFHGPPGTGKTLMARALASSCTHQGKKITFFMRKGADCLSKWIGEAERQLRVLFDEAKAKQPSIIFFDEIDGLAPVRSSKQEQIHASIVSTLLALMDGMDNRGQVVVIGATNRPDSVDPALRRPGRFDREFYFPLPKREARIDIIKIHTKKWDPPLEQSFIEHIADMTKGYGGADLRALTTEAALNAIQRSFPQIYASDKKLLVKPENINVLPRDFVKSLDRIVPSSMRSSTTGSSPLPARIEPVLRSSFNGIKSKIDLLLPRSKPMTALEEALREDDNYDFEYQQRLKDFKTARVHRPRLLIHGQYGMGQEYIGSAIMNFLEGVYSQVIDLGALYGDSMKTPEASIVQMLVEAKKRTPAVLIIPNLEVWFSTVSPQLQATFFSTLRTLAPTDQVLLIGIASEPASNLDPKLAQFFGFSSANTALLNVENSPSVLSDFYGPLKTYIESLPTQTMEPEDRPLRKLEPLPDAPEEGTGAEQKDPEVERREQEKKDYKTRSQLKVKLGGLMDNFKNRYRRFRKPLIDDLALIHLFETPNPDAILEYERSDDNMIIELSTGKKYHNMDLDVIEDRLWNGFYIEPKQFLQDLELIHADANVHGDRERIHKSSEMLANAQVAIDDINDVAFLQACRDLRHRVATAQLKALDEVDQDLEDEEEPMSITNGELAVDESGLNGNQSHIDDQMDVDTDVVVTAPGATDVAATDVAPENDLTVPGTPAAEPTNHKVLSVNDLLAAPVSKASNTNASVPSLPSPTEDVQKFTVDRTRVNNFISRLVEISQGFNLDQLELVYAAMVDIAWRYRKDWDRSTMLNELEKQLDSLPALVI